MEHIEIDQQECDGCEMCVDICPCDGVYMEYGTAHVDLEECDVCGMCIPRCHKRAIIYIEDDE